MVLWLQSAVLLLVALFESRALRSAAQIQWWAFKICTEPQAKRGEGKNINHIWNVFSGIKGQFAI